MDKGDSIKKEKKKNKGGKSKHYSGSGSINILLDMIDVLCKVEHLSCWRGLAPVQTPVY